MPRVVRQQHQSRSDWTTCARVLSSAGSSSVVEFPREPSILPGRTMLAFMALAGIIRAPLMLASKQASSIHRPCYLHLHGFLACMALAGLVHARSFEELQKLSVPLEIPSPETDTALSSLKAALASVHPARKQAPTVISTKGEPYILYGDLFHTGGLFHPAQIYAVVDLPESGEMSVPNQLIGLGFAEWKDDHWEPRSLLRSVPIWHPKGWVKGEYDYIPITPAEKPFWLMGIDGKGAIGVVVADDVEKYYQSHLLFAFDPKQHRLVPIAEAMKEPRLIDGWVRLYYNFGRLPIFEEWRFARWNGERLVERGSWHDETPNHDPEHPFVEVTHTDDHDKTVDYRVVEAGGYNIVESIYTITKEEKPFAHVTFKWGRSGPNGFQSEEYLFEKLTGLPRKLFPERDEEKPAAHVESFKSVIVTGDPEAVRMLSHKS